MTRTLVLAAVVPGLLCSGASRTAAKAFDPSLSADIDPAQLCRAAIAATERTTRIPDAFLSAIGRVESGRAADGVVSPWPWTVNAAGSGHVYATKTDAIAAVHQFLAAGIRSIDVGCLQVNLFYHPDAFTSLEQAFDPAGNAAYAAKLLMELFQRTGSWPRAAAAYHSLTPALGLAYQQKVLEAWATPDRTVEARAGRVPGEHAAMRPSREFNTAAGDTPAVPTPDMPAPPPIQAAAAGTPPSFGFNRRFMLPASQATATGKTLAAYRMTSVQLAWRLPAQAFTR